jgi:hypothetical protein
MVYKEIEVEKHGQFRTTVGVHGNRVRFTRLNKRRICALDNTSGICICICIKNNVVVSPKAQVASNREDEKGGSDRHFACYRE